MGLLKYNL